MNNTEFEPRAAIIEKMKSLAAQKKKAHTPAISASQGPIVVGEKTGRNDPCPCGSGKKYKKCCALKESAAEETIETTPMSYHQVCESYIAELYTGLSGFISYQPGEKETAQLEKVFLTYGEILFPSFNKILERIEISEDDVFYDLGSGAGKSALQFFLTAPAKKTVAIEANQKRFDVSMKIYKQVKRELPEVFEDGKTLEYLHSNFLDVDISDATIIYICSTCFNTELLADIGKIIDKCPNIKYVVSIPSVTYDYASIPCKLPIEEVVDIECSWGHTKFYLYTVAPANPVDPKTLPSYFAKPEQKTEAQ
jgi:precorrin-6B methylase 2